MSEEFDIPEPWQPESHKPALPFVICTDGHIYYWIAHWNWDSNEWVTHYAHKYDGEWVKFNSCAPLAWVEPEKFVPFVKKPKRHKCIDAFNMVFSEEMDSGLWVQLISMCGKTLQSKVKFCPLCGWKASKND